MRVESDDKGFRIYPETEEDKRIRQMLQERRDEVCCEIRAVLFRDCEIVVFIPTKDPIRLVVRVDEQ